MTDTKQETCPRCGSPDKQRKMHNIGAEVIECLHSWHTLPHQAPAPRLELPTDNGRQPEARRDWRPMGQNWNAEPAVPPVSAEPQRWPTDVTSPYPTQQPGPPPPAEPTPLDKLARAEWDEGIYDGVPAEPRSAERLQSMANDLLRTLNKVCFHAAVDIARVPHAIGVIEDWAEAYAQPIREQLAAAEQEKEGLRVFKEDNIKLYTQLETAEAALLSAQKEIERLRQLVEEGICHAPLHIAAKMRAALAEEIEKLK
jgi:hypothetical protein